MLYNQSKKGLEDVLIGLDVESANTSRLDSVMSIGYAVMSISGNLIEKETIYFPFHKSELQYDGTEYDTFTFWTQNNKEIYEKHCLESTKLGFEPNIDGVTINKKSKRYKQIMRDNVTRLSNMLFRIQKDYNVRAIITDCQYDPTVINYLLYKILEEPQLTMRRVIHNGEKDFCWGMKCIDTGSFVASVNSGIHCGDLDMSENTFLFNNDLRVPQGTAESTHDPSDDSERMLAEFILIWNTLEMAV